MAVLLRKAKLLKLGPFPDSKVMIAVLMVLSGCKMPLALS